MANFWALWSISSSKFNEETCTLSCKLRQISGLMLETCLNIATSVCQNDRNKEIIQKYRIWGIRVVPQKSCGKEKSVNSIITVPNISRMLHFEAHISSSFHRLFQLFSRKDLWYPENKILKMVKNYPPAEMTWFD